MTKAPEVTPEFMAEQCAPHWSNDDKIFVASVMMKCPHRVAHLLSAYAGKNVTGKTLAMRVLRLAKRIHSEGGQAS